MVQPGQEIVVSVCIPAYNDVALLKRCLESVLMQEDALYEIVISDDSGHDSVGELVLSYLSPLIRYHRNTVALGSPANWNKAISLATGRYIKLMHHDDYFSRSDSLFRFVKALEDNPEAAMAFSYATILFRRQQVHHLSRITRAQLRRVSADPSFLFYRNVIGNPSSVIFRRSSEVVFDESLKWLVDVELYWRLLNVAPQVVSIGEALVVSVDGEEGQITGQVADDPRIVIPEHLSVFERFHEPALENKSSSLYFQELFQRFGLHSLEDLKSQFRVPEILEPFLKRVFADMKKARWWKKLKKRLLTSRYNKRLFRIERF